MPPHSLRRLEGYAEAFVLMPCSSRFLTFLHCCYQLLTRSQLEAEYFALGLGPPQYINKPDVDGGMSCIVILNAMEPVEWSFFPSTLTRSFPGRSMQVQHSSPCLSPLTPCVYHATLTDRLRCRFEVWVSRRTWQGLSSFLKRMLRHRLPTPCWENTDLS